MTFNPQSSYPFDRTYVLKLHLDARPAEGKLVGRLEHVASGRVVGFESAEDMLACLADPALRDDTEKRT